jgi:hypothetical protein
VKYILTNEKFNTDRIVSNIEDILLELNDVGYQTDVEYMTNLPYPRTTGKNKYIIDVYIVAPKSHLDKLFIDVNEYDLVRQSVIRIKRHMDDVNFQPSNTSTLRLLNNFIHSESIINMKDGDIIKLSFEKV